MGGNLKEIIFNVLLVEALPRIIRSITVTLISIIGFSTMSGTVGGGIEEDTISSSISF